MSKLRELIKSKDTFAIMDWWKANADAIADLIDAASATINTLDENWGCIEDKLFERVQTLRATLAKLEDDE